MVPGPSAQTAIKQMFFFISALFKLPIGKQQQELNAYWDSELIRSAYWDLLIDI